MIKFGTGGWRAIIADEFTKQNVQLVAQGLADRIHAEGVAERGIVVGYDRRFMSAEFAWWATEVIVANGIAVRIVDRPAPTPMIMYTVKNQQTPYGLAITASHNPALYNGVKLFTAGGKDADITITDELQAHVAGLGPDDIRAVPSDQVRSHELVTIQTSMNWYIDSILNQIDTEVIRHKHLKVVLDPMFGVAQTCLQTVLVTARVDLDVINSRHDTLFGGRTPSPNLESLADLCNAVIDQGADLGVATDGDADRLGIFDNAGNFMSANQLMVLLYRYLVTTKRWDGPVVRNIATTHMLDRVARSLGQECHEVPVGFKHISAKMAETNAVIGGESSGGMTVRGHIAGKDGIYSASLLVEMLAASDKTLSQMWAEIIEEFGDLQMIETAWTFTPERKAELTQTLFDKQELPQFTATVDHVSYLDGLKVYFEGDGWLVCRFSGTEPVLRIFAEMPTMAQAEQAVNEMVEFLGLA